MRCETVQGRTRRLGALAAIAVMITAAVAAHGPTSASAVTPEPSDVVVTVDRHHGPSGVSSLAVGTTHTQFSLERSGDAESVARGKALLADAFTYQNQHLYGWGTVNPMPAPGVYSWRSLDKRVDLMRSTGATPVITLCCAPDWMTSVGAEVTTYPNRPPLAAHYDDFADLARQVALRYPDVRHFVVWNEMKGLWNPDAGQWDYVSYTHMYNAVYDALKGVDPDIQVGGPYMVIEATGSLRGGALTSAPITPRNRVALRYWLEHAHGADFIAIDRKVKDYHDTRVYTDAERFALTSNFRSIVEQVKAMTDLPVWYIEDHFVGKAGGRTDFQAAGVAAMLYNQLLGGAVVSMGWEPEQYPVGGPIQEHVFTSTLEPGGGVPLPLYDSYRWFHHEFAPGTPLYPVTTSAPGVLALANAERTLLISTVDAPLDIELDGNRFTVAPYEVTLRELDGTRVPPVHEAAGSASAMTEQSDPALETAAPGSEPYAEPTTATPASSAAVPAEPALDWLDRVSTLGADRASDVAIAAGGVFAVGSSYGAIGTGTYRGGNDAWVRRYSRDGALVWERQFGSAHDDNAAGVAADRTGVYIVGTTDHAFDGGFHAGAFDVYVRRYDLNGRLLWHRQFGTAWDETARGVKVLDGVVYVTGGTDAPSFDGVATTGYEDVFLAAFDRAGTRQWSRTFGTEQPDVVTELAVSGGDLVISGLTAGSLPGSSSAGHWDAFLLRVDATGALQWARQLGTPGDDRAFGVEAVSDNGDVVLAGRVEGAFGGAAFQGLYDGFVRRYDRDGGLVWHRELATPRVDRAVDVAVDAAGVHVVAVTDGEFPGEVRAGGDDILLASLSDDGMVTSLSQWGSDKADDASGFASDPTRLAIAGSTFGVLPGEASSPTDNLPPPASVVPVDGFVAQWSDPHPFVALDDFERGDGTGWGSAPFGGRWRQTDRAKFAVASGAGRLVVIAGHSESATLDGADGGDVAVSARLSLDRLPSGGHFVANLAARTLADGSEYRVRLRVGPDGAASLRLLRRDGYTPVLLSAEVPVGTIIPGAFQRLDLELTGAGETVLKGRFVADGDASAAWQVTTTDTSPALQGSGSIGVRAGLAGTGPHVTLTVDDLVATRV